MGGIYKILNTITDDCYIGSTTQSFVRRKTRHYNDLANNNHKNSKLQNAYNKYGKENLVFQIIEECEIEITLQREQFYIDTLKPRYNINPIATSSLGVKRSNEFKSRLREQQLDYYKQANNNKGYLTDISTKFVYKLIHLPSGKLLFEQSISDFCKNNNLKNWKLHSTFNDSVSKKKYNQHNGFKILEKIPIENIVEYFK